MTLIKNGRAFPKAVKLAAIKATKLKSNKGRSVAAIAADFNVAPQTLNTWRRQAGTAAPQPTQLAAHQAASAAIKAFNTPTIIYDAGGLVVQGIELRGKVYR